MTTPTPRNDIRALIAAARRNGVVIHLDPHRGTAIIHNHRDPTMHAAHVEPLRRRRAEVAACLAGDRPPPSVAAREERYRAAVLNEPDVSLGELSWPVLAAMVIGIVRETIAVERAEREWQASIARHDDPPPPRARGRWVAL